MKRGRFNEDFSYGSEKLTRSLAPVAERPNSAVS